MPSKRTKYNARFPTARIKKIMQSDEEVGKVAAAVPVVISRALELFLESLISQANDCAKKRRANTLTTSHIKRVVESNGTFSFLRDSVANIPDLSNSPDLYSGGADIVEDNQPRGSSSSRTCDGEAPRVRPRRGRPKKTAVRTCNSSQSSRSGDDGLREGSNVIKDAAADASYDSASANDENTPNSLDTEEVKPESNTQSFTVDASQPAATLPAPAATFPAPAATFPAPATTFPAPATTFPAPAPKLLEDDDEYD